MSKRLSWTDLKHLSVDVSKFIDPTFLRNLKDNDEYRAIQYRFDEIKHYHDFIWDELHTIDSVDVGDKNQPIETKTCWGFIEQYNKRWAVFHKSVFFSDIDVPSDEDSDQPINSIISEQSTMSERKILTISLIDPDKGLDVSKSLVARFTNVLTEDDFETTKLDLVANADNKISEKIAAHNKVRAEEINLDILNRTGNEVKLLPIKLKDLKWIIQ